MSTLLIIGVVALAVYGAYLLSPQARFRRRLAALPLSDIVAAGPPAAKVRGVVQPGEALRAPLSLRLCVAYEVVVEEKRPGKSRSWVRRVREARAVDFLLRDASGLARVRVAGAPLVTCFSADHQSASGTFDDPTRVEAELLARHRVTATNFLGFNRSLRYSESAVVLGETVVVAGRAAREVDPAAAGDGYREAPTRLLLTGDEAFPLHLSDDPKVVL